MLPFCHHLSSLDDEKDVSVIVDSSLGFQKPLSSNASIANQILGLVWRLRIQGANASVSLYNVLVRPHLECANQA